jgi:hypothetical protein
LPAALLVAPAPFASPLLPPRLAGVVAPAPFWPPFAMTTPESPEATPGTPPSRPLAPPDPTGTSGWYVLVVPIVD